MTIRIRTARADERLMLEELQRRASLAWDSHREALLAHPEAIEIPVEQIVSGQVRVAEMDGRTCGFSAWLLRDDSDFELDGLFVEPEYWRCGIGRALVNDLAQIARTAAACNIHVIANPNALTFYEAMGFVRLGAAETLFGPAERWVFTL